MTELMRLKAQIESIREEANNLKRQVWEKEAQANRLQIEYDKAEREIFWKTHDGLRVNRHDELSITQDYLEQFLIFNKGSTALYVGKVVKLDHFSSDGTFAIYWDSSTVANVSLEHIQAMRQAWLDRQVETIEKG